MGGCFQTLAHSLAGVVWISAVGEHMRRHFQSRFWAISWTLFAAVGCGEESSQTASVEEALRDAGSDAGSNADGDASTGSQTATTVAPSESRATTEVAELSNPTLPATSTSSSSPTTSESSAVEPTTAVTEVHTSAEAATTETDGGPHSQPPAVDTSTLDVESTVYVCDESSAVEPTTGEASHEATTDSLGDAGLDGGTVSVPAASSSGDDASSAPLQMSTNGQWCANPIAVVVVKGGGSILNNPHDDLSQVNAAVLERLTICPGEQTTYCDATAQGELVSVIMRECWLPEAACPVAGQPVASGCSQSTMEDIYGPYEPESSHYLAQGCCFEGQLGEVYTETCTTELEGAHCPAADECSAPGTCVQGACVAGGARDCNDGFFCNGEEWCLPGTGCMRGDVPQFDDDPCNVDSCNEDDELVSHEPLSNCPSLCVGETDVHLGYLSVADSERPNWNAQVTHPTEQASVASETLTIGCGASADSSISTLWGEYGCGRTANGEVFVQNEAGVAVSQPVSIGCSYELQERETKLSGFNGYEGFVVGCCLGAEPFTENTPNLEPWPSAL